jgi:membrane protease YdiL (CAAX protease family)
MRKFPVVTFFILAIVLGGGTVFLVAQSFLPSIGALASAISASISGLLMTAIVDGKEGIKRLLKRLLIWRVDLGYWLFAFLALVPIILLGSLCNPLFNGDPLILKDIQLGFELIPTFIGFFIIAGLGQELGWTGFLVTRLQARYSALASCIFRALLVSLWHLPLYFLSIHRPQALMDFPYGEWIAQYGFLIAFGTMLILFLIPWSIFITWIYNNTRGSLLLAAVLHGSEIWAAYAMISAGIDPKDLNNYWGYGGLMILGAVILILRSGPKNLSRKYNRIVD